MTGAARRWWRYLRTPPDCGGGPPRYLDLEWSDEVSPDQARIEAAISSMLRPEHVVLHVGIGTSRIARLFGDRVARIDGITVVLREIEQAPSTYRPVLLDKLRALPDGPYDWILDNNPSSFSCCRRHFHALLDGYAERLAPGGRLVTDTVGLAYAEPYAFGVSARRFARLGRARGLDTEWLGESVLAWRR